MAKKINASAPKIGMIRDVHPSQLNESQYTYAINGNIENESGGFLNLQNEKSNILANQFYLEYDPERFPNVKRYFKVIHAVNDIDTDDTYVFLTDPISGVGQFGVLRNNQATNDLSDIDLNCDECHKIKELAEPLESLTQIELQPYEKLIDDACHIANGEPEKGFMFNVLHPIKKSVIKNEKLGKTIYFDQIGNPPRYINISNIDKYYTEEIPCSDDAPLTCANFDKMRVFPQFEIPQIMPTSIALGGNLKMGVYEFLVAYCDASGNEISEYYSITNPISIFDKNNIILAQPNLADRTNFAIRLDLTGLDKKFQYYKIAVIQTADIEGASRYFIEGIHPINDTTIIYATEQNKVETSIDNLARVTIKVEEAELVTTANNILYHSGITVKKEVNLQPVVNLMGEFLKWQTHIASEDLYENGINNSLYVGYTRDEVVPFGIRFLMRGGVETPLFPFIGRVPNEEDLDILAPETNDDVASIISNIQDCNSVLRDKRWQFYNTATVDVDFCGGDIETVEVQETVEATCEVLDIAPPTTNNTLTIPLLDEFTDLVSYVNDNAANCAEKLTSEICGILSTDYTSVPCDTSPFEDGCSDIVEESYTVEAYSATGETYTETKKTFGSEYADIPSPLDNNLYQLDSSGNPTHDTANEALYSPAITIYNRIPKFAHESCVNAVAIVENQTTLQNIAQAYYNNYYFTTGVMVGNPDALLDLTRNTASIGVGFYSNLHKGALWYKGAVLGRSEFILDVAKQKDNPNTEYFDTVSQIVRLSIFKDCAATDAIFTVAVDLNAGAKFLLKKSGADLQIIASNGTLLGTFSGDWFTANTFLVTIDNRIEQTTILGNYAVTPTKGTYTVTTRNTEIKSRTVTWTDLKFKKLASLTATCTFNQPVVQSCKAIPYKKGRFAYWESQETYPNNDELYNSETLVVRPSDFQSADDRTIFENAFAIENGDLYDWKVSNKVEGDASTIAPNVDFTCRNIRHFKFPDNSKAPFMADTKQLGGTNSLIYPLGVTISEEVINSFLDIALNNNLISKSERESIVAYEIVRGDLNLNRSIVASGLLYDMRKYQERGKSINVAKNDYTLYPNYPFNTMREDIFNRMGDKPDTTTLFNDTTFGISNTNYTFHSPETDFNAPTLPSEMNIQGYMYGEASTQFNEVLDHPKWVMLTDQARTLADVLAALEVATDLAIIASNAANNMFAGFTTNYGTPFSFVAIGVSLLGEVTKFGKYRYEWLKIFRDLGTPHNFAYYSFSVGKYNYLQLEQEEGNTLRGLNVAKYLKEGRFKTTNEVNAQRLDINNIDRERSVFLSTGDYEITYPTQYKSFDKGNDRASLTFLGERGLSETGLSSEVKSNIASPYVHLRAFLPQQHGTIDSIRWLTTGYRGDLTAPRTDCLSIFGGDTYISRHTLKRKHSQFLTTSMGQADRTPFNYYFYNNIGRNPKFFVSYNMNIDFKSSIYDALFPDIQDVQQMDNYTKSGNYIVPPSKFYLYYYGIPSFLCETRINTNYRYAEKELERNFYPQVGDVGNWTQEKNVSIRQPNYFFYNKSYSKQVTPLKLRSLSTTFNREVSNKTADLPNGIIASLPDNSENSTYDPWLVYRPLDRFEFPTNYGKLKDLVGIENEAILARFENTSVIYNKVDYTNDDGQNPTKAFLGGTVFFQRRSAGLVNSQLGFGGTQNSQSVSCSFGHFHVDAKRGQVIHIQPAGQGTEEISSLINGKPSGMRQWFKEHLPFKILKYIKNVDVDNNFNGVGISMAYDSRYRRIFITKKDYIPLKSCIEYDEKLGFIINKALCEEIDLEPTCPEGYTYNAELNICEKVVSTPICPIGYNYELDGNCYNPDIPDRFPASCDSCTQEDDMCICTEQVEPIFKADLNNPEFFEDVSWTVAYNPLLGSWLSYYDFKPNYYISHNGYFQSGINISNDNEEFGCWNHGLTNKSFGVFYGKKFPFEVEYIVKSTNQNKTLGSISLHTELKRYHNQYDSATNLSGTFNKAIIYNDLYCSGDLNLVPQQKNFVNTKGYPKNETDGSQSILTTNMNDTEWSFNYFFNRTRDNSSNIPSLLWDKNQIDFTVNSDIVTFKPIRRTLDRLNGEWFKTRLSYDKDSRLSLTLKFVTNEEDY